MTALDTKDEKINKENPFPSEINLIIEIQTESDNYVSTSIKNDTSGHLSQVLKGSIKKLLVWMGVCTQGHKE